MKFDVHQVNHIGGRRYNQDRVGYSYTNNALLLVLADGMGGHLHGELAAQIAVNTFMRAFSRLEDGIALEPEVFLRTTMREGHDAIIHYAEEQQLGGNPGTTCVAALVQGGKIWFGHAGDSRFYLIRDGLVAQVTKDHSVVQQWADWGLITHEQMKVHPDRNKITNCLGGVDDMFYVEVSPSVDLHDHDTLLLCSDGFWTPFADDELVELSASMSLRNSLGRMVETAVFREGEGADNTTAIVARLGRDEPENETAMPVCRVLDERSAVA